MTKDELKFMRDRLGFTAKEMALRLKTPLRTYGGWEQGRSIPGVVEVAVISLIRQEMHAGMRF